MASGNIILLLLMGMLLLGCAQTGGTQAGGQAASTANQSGSTGGGNAGNGSGGGVPGTGDGSSAAARVTVHIRNFAFDPAEITVKQGQTVAWVNDDSVQHIVKADGFESPALQNGGTYEHIFTEAPGEYTYICGIHPSMHGKVTVTK